MSTPQPFPVAGNPNVNVWWTGTTYPPGSVVRPTTSPEIAPLALANSGFEAGNLSGWTPDAGWSISNVKAYEGVYSASVAPGYGSGPTLYKNQIVTVIPGQHIGAECYFHTNDSVNATVELGIYWYSTANAGAGGGPTATGYLGKTMGGPGNLKGVGQFAALAANDADQVGTRGIAYPPGYTPPATWFSNVVNGYAPVSAAYAQLYARISNPGANPTFVDAFNWNYYAPHAAQQIFYAVQPVTGKSGYTEPVWRDTTLAVVGPPAIAAGTPITDGTVLWSSTPPATIEWSAEAIMYSGPVEPVWPTSPGSMVRNGTIDWVAVTPQVADPNDVSLPPQSKYVFIAASKVFALDGDIARYCATVNCLDWTTEANAGYLPIGLRAFGTNPFIAAGMYRSNAVFMNAEGLQMWQVDEDPANMAMLDAVPIGCTQHRSIASVNDDMLFLSAQGVRSMGISAGSGNLQAGDVGMPVDPLMQPAMLWAAANGVTPIGGYFPSLGQYFLAIQNWPADDLFWSSGGTGVAPAVSIGGGAYTVKIPGAILRSGMFYSITFPDTRIGTMYLNIDNSAGAPNYLGQLPLISSGGVFPQAMIVTYEANYAGGGPAFKVTGGFTRLFVYTMGRTGEVGSWSHYALQFALENFCQSGDSLYMRGMVFNVPMVFTFDANQSADSDNGGNLSTYGVVQWPWLDDGTPALTKQLSGFDMAVTMNTVYVPQFTVEIGYDQTNKNAFTTPYTVIGDTYTGMMYPIQVKAPSFAMRLVFESSVNWSMQAATLYLTDKRTGS